MKNKRPAVTYPRITTSNLDRWNVTYHVTDSVWVLRPKDDIIEGSSVEGVAVYKYRSGYSNCEECIDYQAYKMLGDRWRGHHTEGPCEHILAAYEWNAKYGECV